MGLRKAVWKVSSTVAMRVVKRVEKRAASKVGPMVERMVDVTADLKAASTVGWSVEKKEFLMVEKMVEQSVV